MSTKRPYSKCLFIPSILLGFSIVSGFILASSTVSADNDSVVDEVNITVPLSCTMSGSGMTSHNASIANGTYNSNIGETTITAFCNDNSGFAIYAIGYTDDTDGKNVLTDSVDTNNDIDTGTATAPVGGNDNSNWAMKLSTVTSPTPTYPITIQNSFDSFHNVPDDYALVAKRTEGTDVGQNAEGSTIKSTYQAYISKTQPAGTYTGQVKYVMVHPNDSAAPKLPTLYNAIAAMSKGTMAENNVTLQTPIGTPTTPYYDTDTSNSGVYTYDSTTFGIASDASNEYPIYFYRGILETNPANYGSGGSAETYPNYIMLSTTVDTSDNTYNTCWRVFRTTGSGGVKIMYNGTWDGATCAKTGSSTHAVSNVYYNGHSSYIESGFITYVGYNHNSSYGYNHTNYTTAINNITLFNNNNPSNARSSVENWYINTIGSNNDSLFESDAGYCNDRSTPGTNNGGTITTTIPYSNSAITQFGSYVRLNTNSTISLTCPNTSSKDLLSVRNGLRYPIALITVDELALSGNGQVGKEEYNKYSYLTSGSEYWSLSPYSRNSSGYMNVYYVNSLGTSSGDQIQKTYGIRPVVSLVHDAIIVSGSGTATDPWIVNIP